jgi:uncharacterized repeat protein (TIGR03809 family)
MSKQQPARALDEVAQKWLDLAERRRAHLVELYHSGRWKRYYREERFLDSLREAIRAVDAWAAIVKPADTEPEDSTRSEPTRPAAGVASRSAA